MIITQTRKSRSFVGSLNPGADVIESLTQICVDNAIFCAQFSGVGYIRDPRLQSYDHAQKGYEPPVAHQGTFHVVALHGNVSLRDRRTVIHAHVVGTLRRGDDPPRLLGGELVGGEVISLEFSLTTIDDIRLYRDEDDRTGLDPWLHMDLGSGPPPAEDESAELPVLPSAPGADNRPEARTSGSGSTSAAEAPKPDDVRPGDWLEHPTLGTCRVITADEDDPVTIELQSGRRVELHLGLLDLESRGDKDGGRLYKVRIRRRR
ncbi:MAG: PPC domain-containing DNA-binding protein [Myxococcota bacterium]